MVERIVVVGARGDKIFVARLDSGIACDSHRLTVADNGVGGIDGEGNTVVPDCVVGGFPNADIRDGVRAKDLVRDKFRACCPSLSVVIVSVVGASASKATHGSHTVTTDIVEIARLSRYED